MQTSHLESRLATLRAQVRRLLALHGLSWTIGLLVPIVILLGLADWLIRSPGHLAAGSNDPVTDPDMVWQKGRPYPFK